MFFSELTLRGKRLVSDAILLKQIELLKVLVDGCKKHPAYRAIRPATGNCEPCVKIWKARLELNDMEKQC